MTANKRRRPKSERRDRPPAECPVPPCTLPPPGPLSALADALLLGLLPLIACLLACVELADPDIWWHLRGGQWILDERQAPGLDPLTFGSADQRWIDLHWLYEVILVLAYRAGASGALILLAATLAGGAVLATLAARRRPSSALAIVACWLPALVLLGFRLDPRPEMFSLLFLACFLAVLSRVRDRPTLIWLLPPLEVLWVNTHSLFVLGPLLVVLLLLSEGAMLAWRWFTGSLRPDDPPPRFWRHTGAGFAAVVAACLLNPYFLDGALFPLELFPKVADADNPYKQTIEEFMSPREYLVDKYRADSVATPNACFVALHLLLQMLPVGFLIPAMWRASRELTPRPAPDTAGFWFGLCLLLTAAQAAHAASPFLFGVPGWLRVPLAWLPLAWLPLAVALAGLAAAYYCRTSQPLAMLVLTGSLVQALWIAWLRSALLTGESGLLGGPDFSRLLIAPLTLMGLISGGLVLRWRGSLFHILVAAAFAYLGLQAIRNWNLFAVAAGALLAWNFGEWGGEVLATRRSSEPHRALAHGLRLAGLVILGIWTAALLTDRYHVRLGEPRRFGWREEPLAFAHDAARFAGQAALPEHALVIPFSQAGVYEFYNAPRCKPFIDARLETPTRETFERYLAAETYLRPDESRWEEIVAGMGQPLILIQHRNQFQAEAALLSHPDWRCIYFDAVASVFVHRSQGVSEQAFPTVDFAQRHFAEPGRSSIPDIPGAATAELEALFNLVTALPPDTDAGSTRTASLLWAALDRAALALSADAERAETWLALSGCSWYSHPDWQTKTDLASAWNVEQDLYWARTTYFLRRALECQPRHRPAWQMLYNAFAVRGLTDALADAGQQWLASDPYMRADQRSEIEALTERYTASPAAAGAESDPVPRVRQLLRDNQPWLATRLAEQAGLLQAKKLSWNIADPLAKAYMHLGQPAAAERIWTGASDAPSESLRMARLAAVSFTQRDFESALERAHAAIDNETTAADALALIALINAEQGNRQRTIEACRQALDQSLTANLRRHLTTLQNLAEASSSE